MVWGGTTLPCHLWACHPRSPLLCSRPGCSPVCGCHRGTTTWARQSSVPAAPSSLSGGQPPFRSYLGTPSSHPSLINSVTVRRGSMSKRRHCWHSGNARSFRSSVPGSGDKEQTFTSCHVHLTASVLTGHLGRGARVVRGWGREGGHGGPLRLVSAGRALGTLCTLLASLP